MASFYFLFVLGTGLLFVRLDTFYPLSLGTDLLFAPSDTFSSFPLGLGLLFAFLDTFCRLLLGLGLLFLPQILFLLCFWVLDYFLLAQILFLLCSYYLHLVYFLFMNCFTTLDSYDTLSLSIRNSKLSKLHFYLQFLENLMLSKINIGRRFSTKKPGNNLTLMASS